MTIHFDEDGAKVDDEFVHLEGRSVRISEIQQLIEQEHQPGWEWPLACFIPGGLLLLVWLPAPFANWPVGLVSLFAIGLGWYKQTHPKPKEFWLTAKASGFAAALTFKSADQSQIQRLRKAIEQVMAGIELKSASAAAAEGAE